MSFLSKVFSFADQLNKIFKGEALNKAVEVGAQISSLVTLALPIAQLVASATPTKADDRVVAAAKAINKPLEALFNEPDKELRKGLLLSLATATLRKFLEEQILKNGSVSLQRLSANDTTTIKISSIDQLNSIDDDLFRSAVQQGFTLWKHSGKPSLI